MTLDVSLTPLGLSYSLLVVKEGTKEETPVKLGVLSGGGGEFQLVESDF